MELFVTHSIKLVTKSVYFLIFIYFSVEMWQERDFSRQQTAGPANHLFVLVLLYRLDWLFCFWKSSSSRNLGKPYEHSGHELFFFRSSEKKNSQSPFPAWITNSFPGCEKMNAAFERSAPMLVATEIYEMAACKNFKVVLSFSSRSLCCPSFPHRLVISLPRNVDEIFLTWKIMLLG